ncbi:MAG TPA: MFS transporter, partial [Duganella sp.]|uniref:MFS transporter n=1 Tax=Duganella sp. TaxID=1904440 RepID=UPI002ED54B2B
MSQNPTTAHDEAAVFKKVSWRLMPFLILVFMLSYLDRVNIGYAKLQFSAELGFSDTVFGIGAGIFFLGYFLFEVPSNLLLKKIGARLTIARIMVLWGTLSTAMLLVRTEGAFYVLRFLLGAAEAGLVPGVLLYLTYWFPAQRRARTTALFMVAIPISGFIGAPLSGAIMQAFHDTAGLRGWQWMFLIEGVPSIMVGVWAAWYLDDGPERANWLDAGERQLIRQRLAHEAQAAREAGGQHSFWAACASRRFWVLTAIYFCSVLGVTGLAFWLPQIIKDLGVTNLALNGRITALPYIAAAAGMLLVSRSSDRSGERRWHYAASALACAGGLVGAGLSMASPTLAVACLALAAAGVYSGLSVFWCMSTNYLQGAAAVAGIAVINSFANLAGYVGPLTMGILRDRTHNPALGLYVIAAFL